MPAAGNKKLLQGAPPARPVVSLFNETEVRSNGIYAFPKHARREAVHHPRDTQTDERPIAHQLCGRQPRAGIFSGKKKLPRASARLLAQDPVGHAAVFRHRGRARRAGAGAALCQPPRAAACAGRTRCCFAPAASRCWTLPPSALCNEGDTIAVEEPCLSGRLQHASAATAQSSAGVPMEEDGVEPCRAGSCVCRAGKARAFSTASPISRTPPERR